ncbi:MAG: glycosyltransferase family 39 protein [Bacteroidota bacterium]
MQTKIALLFSYLFLFLVGVFYYPKWEKGETEATLSWDVSGYYFYLPAFLIYEDAKQLQFAPEILEKYSPTPDLQQAYRHENGNMVMKYSSGQAIIFSPFFAVAHLVAQQHPNYPPDGFSFPYQLSIGLGSLLICFIGLFFLAKILRHYFEDRIAALTLLILVLTSNYLEYGAISSAMTHNSLFTIYTLLIWTTIQFYKKPDFKKAILIGVCVGLAALTRPTEIIACLIPILWGIPSISSRLKFFQEHWAKLLSATIVTLAIGSIQLMYWKYVTGDFIVYSYEEQGFSWLRPHLKDGFFSTRAGWLTYTPIMTFALLGFYFLYRKSKALFWSTFVFSILFIYITFAWDIWWYGGSLGQRAMVQAYPVLAIPLAAFLAWIWRQKVWKHAFLAVSALFLYYNFWLIHQAHLGGLLRPGEMTKPYFWGIVGRFDVAEEKQKLLDTNELFQGERKDVQLLFEENFSTQFVDTLQLNGDYAISPPYGMQIDNAHPFSPFFEIEKQTIPKTAKWLRASAHFVVPYKEYNTWMMTQFTVKFMNGEEAVKTKKIRLHRFLENEKWRELWIDTKIPDEAFSKVRVYFWNTESPKQLFVDDLKIESFR